jgi:DHA2 family multidrug resistance protein
MGPALGPPLGGYLVDNFSWNWCFDINVIPGIFATIVLLLLLRDPSKAQRSPIDGVGLALLAIGLGTMQYVLTEGEQNYWFADPLIAAMTVISVIALVAFGWWEINGTPGPVVDLKVMRYRSVWAGSILAFVLGVSVFGSSYVLPQFTQGALGYTPTLSGLLFILRALPIALFTPLAVRLSGKVDARILLTSGFVLLGTGGVLQAFITSSSVEFWDFFIPLALSGAGSAMLWIPLTIAILGGTPPKDSPKAAAFTNLFVQLGGSIAVAVLAVLLHSRESFHSTIIGANLTPANMNVQQFLDHNSIAQLAQIAYGQSTILAFEDVNFAIGILAFICIPLVLLIKKRAGGGAAGPVHVEMG